MLSESVYKELVEAFNKVEGLSFLKDGLYVNTDARGFDLRVSIYFVADKIARSVDFVAGPQGTTVEVKSKLNDADLAKAGDFMAQLISSLHLYCKKSYTYSGNHLYYYVRPDWKWWHAHDLEVTSVPSN